MLDKLLKYLSYLNNSKFFAGLVMIMLNIGSKYITVELSKKMIETINSGKDVVIASRYKKNADIRGLSNVRRLLSYISCIILYSIWSFFNI